MCTQCIRVYTCQELVPNEDFNAELDEQLGNRRLRQCRIAIWVRAAMPNGVVRDGDPHIDPGCPTIHRCEEGRRMRLNDTQIQQGRCPNGFGHDNLTWTQDPGDRKCEFHMDQDAASLQRKEDLDRERRDTQKEIDMYKQRRSGHQGGSSGSSTSQNTSTTQSGGSGKSNTKQAGSHRTGTFQNSSETRSSSSGNPDTKPTASTKNGTSQKSPDTRGSGPRYSTKEHHQHPDTKRNPPRDRPRLSDKELSKKLDKPRPRIKDPATYESHAQTAIS